MPITLVSASLLGLLLVYLSVAVVKQRGRASASVGDGGDDKLQHAIRAHGNLTEYAPMGLILIGLLEGLHANHYVVLSIAVAFVAGRYMHGLTFGKFEGRNPFRVWGVLLTFIALLVASVAGLIQVALMV